MRAHAILLGLAVSFAGTSGSTQPAPEAAASEGPSSSVSKSVTAAFPSFGYQKKVALWIRANIKPPSDPSTQIIAGTAEITIDVAPDGKISRARLSKSSGSGLWDGMVEEAVARAGKVPLDVDGRVPPQMVFAFSPR